MDSHLFKTKSIEQLITDVERGERAHRRRQSGRPGDHDVVPRGGLACAFAALCYTEFASMIPIAGSACTYAYATLGELAAWMIGWDLILEYAVGAMTVAIGWSGYMQQLLATISRSHGMSGRHERRGPRSASTTLPRPTPTSCMGSGIYES